MENRETKYHKIINDLKFTDGFSLKAGSTVMEIGQEDDFLNVQIEDTNTKRIFWVNKKEVLFKCVKKEKWGKKKIEQHNIDIGEKWLDNEQKTNGTPAGNTSVAKKATRTKPTTGNSKITKRTTRKGSSVKPIKKAGKKITKGKSTKSKR